MRVSLTQQEAIFLFGACASYGAAKQQQKEGSPNWADAASREEDVLAAYRLIKKAAREETPGAYKLGPDVISDEWRLELNLHDSQRDGIFWALLAALDPRSPAKASVIDADSVVWPVAQKVRREQALRKELKLTETKKQKIDDDPCDGIEEINEEAASVSESSKA